MPLAVIVDLKGESPGGIGTLTVKMSIPELLIPLFVVAEEDAAFEVTEGRISVMMLGEIEVSELPDADEGVCEAVAVVPPLSDVPIVEFDPGEVDEGVPLGLHRSIPD